MRVWVQPAGKPPIYVEVKVENKINLEWTLEKRERESANLDSKTNCRDGTRVFSLPSFF